LLIKKGGLKTFQSTVALCAADVHEKCEVQIFRPLQGGVSVTEKFVFGFRGGLFVYFLPNQKVKRK
jgi:hypothetical protein